MLRTKESRAILITGIIGSGKSYLLRNQLIELMQKRQRMRIETALESQINKELMMKTNMAKDIKYKVKEQEYMKELEKRKIENEQKEKILENGINSSKQLNQK